MLKSPLQRNSDEHMDGEKPVLSELTLTLTVKITFSFRKDQKYFAGGLRAVLSLRNSVF